MKSNLKNFVCREKVQFTKSEINQVINHINGQFAGNKYGIVFDGYRIEKNVLNTLILDYKMPVYTGRDSDNGRLTMRAIHVLIWKEKGQIEIDWKNGIYEDYNGFAFSGDICFYADWIAYRCKHKQGYQKKNPYSYGEYISELDFSAPINYLYRDLAKCKKIA